jgi:hypothetical protein
VAVVMVVRTRVEMLVLAPIRVPVPLAAKGLYR